ncbi:MAG: hypothetical protein LAT61_11530 [Alcanivorax sp.]|nr:hypothetical protein [Alcanivorax sp.]
MSYPNKYRFAILSIFMLEVLYSSLPWGWAYFGHQDVLFWVGAGSTIPKAIDIAITYAISGGFLLSYAGLFFFQNWARYLLLVTTVSAVVATPFYGVAVSSGIESMVGFLLGVAAGFILAISFFSEFSLFFKGEAKAD